MDLTRVCAISSLLTIATLLGSCKKDNPPKSIVKFAFVCNECDLTFTTSDHTEVMRGEGYGYWSATGDPGSTAVIRCTEIVPDPSGVALFIWVNGAPMGVLDSEDIGNPVTCEFSAVIP